MVRRTPTDARIAVPAATGVDVAPPGVGIVMGMTDDGRRGVVA